MLCVDRRTARPCPPSTLGVDRQTARPRPPPVLCVDRRTARPCPPSALGVDRRTARLRPPSGPRPTAIPTPQVATRRRITTATSPTTSPKGPFPPPHTSPTAPGASSRCAWASRTRTRTGTRTRTRTRAGATNPTSSSRTRTAEAPRPWPGTMTPRHPPQMLPTGKQPPTRERGREGPIP